MPTSDRDRFRILQIISAGNAGGGERIVLSVGLELGRRGHNVGLVCANAGWLTESLSTTNLKPHVFGMNGARKYAVAARVAKEIKSGGYDLIHSHLSRATKVAHIASLMTGKPVVATCHSLRGDSIFSKIARAPNRIIAVSRHVKAYLVNQGIPCDAIETIYNGTNFYQIAESDRKQTLDELGVPTDRFVIGMIGRVQESKGSYDLLEAVSRLCTKYPNIHCVFVGPIKAQERKRIVAFAQSHEIDERLTITGPQHNVAKYLDSFDVLAMPSHAEAFGLAAIEAMARARPVVAYDVGGLPEVIHHEENGLLVPRCVQALSVALSDLLRDQEEAKRMGLRGRQMVKERFSLSRMVDEYESAYTAVLQPARQLAGHVAKAGLTS